MIWRSQTATSYTSKRPERDESTQSESGYQSENVDDKDGNLSIKSLGDIIKTSTSIEEILLCGTNIVDSDIEAIAPYFEGNTTLRRLDLSGNYDITDKSISHLIRIVELSKIKHIRITFTGITQNRALAVPVARNLLIRGSEGFNFNHEYKGFNDDDMINICKLMKIHGLNKLKSILFNVNDMTSKGAAVLFDTLKECSTIISKLNLSNNQIGDECMKHLGEFIKSSNHLEKLSLEGNNITDDGVEILSDYLVGNTSLKELHLGCNNVTDKGMELLSNCLMGNTTLKELNLAYNYGITDASASHLADIARRSCIARLVIHSKNLSDEIETETSALLEIPVEEREIPIKSNCKSAAKISASFMSVSTVT